MKYLKKFENHASYEDARQNLILPNVSLCAQENEVHYNPFVETKLVVYYDIQDISSPTTICTNFDRSIKSIEVDGVLLDSVVTTYQFDSVGEHVIKYEFNNSTTVGNSAPLFGGITTIKRVVIPNTFTAIGSNAFYDCSSLASITIPDGVTSIGGAAFMSCISLTSVTIPDGVTSIGQSAFAICSNLTSVTIGDSVTSIGDGAFFNCSSLASINVSSGNTVYDSRNNCNAIIETETNTLVQGCNTTIIPNSVTSIGINAFYGCSSLASITIPDGVTSIGSNAFYGCSSLASIIVNSNNTTYDSRNNCNAIIETETNTLVRGCNTTIIPNSVTSIDSTAFSKCSGLTSIDIPNSVTNIGNSAFSDCSSLTSVTSLATTAPTIEWATFQNVKTNGTLYVPQGSTGYDTWMGTDNFYLGKYGWTKVEQ